MMTLKSRQRLPYRKNCEAYLLYKGDQVLARDTGKGYLEFPGGGFDLYETPKQAVAREVFEETGAVVEDFKKIGVLHFDWGPSWAKTEKQKQRYKEFRGEEMHLFTGRVKRLTKPKGCPITNELGWKGKRMMPIDSAIDFINTQRPFPKTMRKYYSKQINILRSLRKRLLDH
jgi:hypothetical protein